MADVVKNKSVAVVDINNEASKIINLLGGKGWYLYYRGVPENKIPVEETYAIGPMSSLEKGIFYLLQPKVSEPTNRRMIQEFINKNNIMPETPRLKVSLDKFDECGRIIYENSEGKILPGNEFPFLGIELQDSEVRIVSKRVLFMPYDVFLESILDLIDLSRT